MEITRIKKVHTVCFENSVHSSSPLPTHPLFSPSTSNQALRRQLFFKKKKNSYSKLYDFVLGLLVYTRCVAMTELINAISKRCKRVCDVEMIPIPVESLSTDESVISEMLEMYICFIVILTDKMLHSPHLKVCFSRFFKLKIFDFEISVIDQSIDLFYSSIYLFYVSIFRHIFSFSTLKPSILVNLSSPSLPLFYSYTHTHTCTHTHTHIYIYIYKQTYFYTKNDFTIKTAHFMIHYYKWLNVILYDIYYFYDIDGTWSSACF